MKSNKAKLKTILRLLIGLVFLASSIFKLISIDSFEIYIYGFGMFSLNFAFILARLIISSELLFGILLITGYCLRKVILASIFTLTVSSVFIVLLLFSDNGVYFHYFGELKGIAHEYLLAKNILLIIILSLIYDKRQIEIKYSKPIVILSLIFCISIPMIISPPDSLLFHKYSQSVSYNDILLKQYLEENNQHTKGKRILCFYGTSCRFCQLATQKMTVIANKSNSTDIINIVFFGSEHSVDHFFEETNSIKFQYSFLPPDKFLGITNGKMPIIILLEDGEVKGKFGYRNINENEIINFIRNNSN